VEENEKTGEWSLGNSVAGDIKGEWKLKSRQGGSKKRFNNSEDGLLAGTGGTGAPI
jgi:hypothetical protein